MAETIIFDEWNAFPDDGEDEREFWDGLREDFREFSRELEALAKPYAGFVISGTAGLWHGRPEVAQTVEDTRRLFDLFDGCELRILDENGELTIEGHHHDGTHLIGVRFLTHAGLEFLDGYAFRDSTFAESREAFRSDVYSAPIRFAERVWGVPAA